MKQICPHVITEIIVSYEAIALKCILAANFPLKGSGYLTYILQVAGNMTQKGANVALGVKLFANMFAITTL